MPKTLLLADDSVVIQKLVGLSFANEDVELVTTDNGDDALARAREFAPDLVLADVVMPGKNGYEVCEAIKADPQLCHTPVLLLTGTFEAFDEERARQVGSDGHITKPFEAQGLVDRVTELFARELPAAPPVPAPAPVAAVAADAAPPQPASDDTYDFFDDDVSELAAPAQQVPTTDANDEAFEFGSSEFAPLAGDDDDPLAGQDFDMLDETLDNTVDPGLDLARDDLTVAVGSEGMQHAITDAVGAETPPPLDATMIAEDFGTPPPIPTAETTLEAGSSLDDDLFGDAQAVPELAPPADPAPIAEPAPITEPAPIAAPAPIEPAPSLDPAMDAAPALETSLESAFEFGLDSPSPAPMATTVLSAGEFGEGDLQPDNVLAAAPAPESPIDAIVDPALDPAMNPSLEPPLSEAPPEVSPEQSATAPAVDDLFSMESAPSPAAFSEPAMESDAAAVGSDWDVSVSDLGQPLSAVAQDTAAVADPSSPPPVSPDLSGVMRDRIHETLEKVAWEAFADLSDTIVRQVLERVESTVWEIVPQMAETLIQEEIRRMKGESE